MDGVLWSCDDIVQT